MKVGEGHENKRITKRTLKQATAGKSQQVQANTRHIKAVTNQHMTANTQRHKRKSLDKLRIRAQ